MAKQKMAKVSEKKFTFIDLFAGIGGIRYGFEDIGFECLMSSEIDPWCQKTYFLNFKEYPKGDIKQIQEDSVPKHNILTAGFPCQPFSISGKQRGFNDTRGTLFFDIMRIIRAKQPEVVFLENVKHLKYHDKGKTLKTILDQLQMAGYQVSWRILNALDFGSAQNRERIFIIGHKQKQFDFDQIKKTPRKKIKDVLDKKGPFEFLEEKDYTLIENPKVQESGLVFVGYRNKKIRENGTRPNTNHLSRVHKQPNRIYSSEGTHPTLPSQESAGRFFIFHNSKVRKLTINECIRLMGFPNKFRKVATNGVLYQQVGNSVYVPMIAELARQIKIQFFGDKNA
jgi:DNA (cytosine-5)-methyltransferase 1